MARSLKKEVLGPDHPGQKARPYLQNNQSIESWRTDSSCRALASKHKALSSNPVLPIEKKKRLL
jgi:hypothetical protein